MRVTISQQLALAEGFEPEIIAALELRCGDTNFSSVNKHLSLHASHYPPVPTAIRFADEGILGTFRDEMQVTSKKA